MNKTDTRTTLNLPAELARRIDDYWHAQRFNSRNEAIRELLVAALDRKEDTGWVTKFAKEKRTAVR